MAENTMRLCTDCKWFALNADFDRRSSDAIRFSLCSKGAAHVSKNQLAEEKYCTVERKDYGWLHSFIARSHCGPNARNFEPINPDVEEARNG